MTDDTVAPRPLDPDNPDDVTTFDLDGWLTDTKLPQRSLVIYRAADLGAKLDELDYQISLAEGGDRSSADGGVKSLKAERNKLAQKIYDSRVVVTVRAVTDDAAKQARADARKEGVKERAAKEWADDPELSEAARDAAEDEAEIEGLDDEDRDALVRKRLVQARRNYIDAVWLQAVAEHLLARCLVSPKLTVEQIRDLSGVIGSAQRDRLFRLPNEAAGEVRLAGAPFSQPSSQARRGGTSQKRSGQQGRGGSRR